MNYEKQLIESMKKQEKTLNKLLENFTKLTSLLVWLVSESEGEEDEETSLPKPRISFPEIPMQTGGHESFGS